MSFLFSPGAGSKLSVTISSTPTEIKGAEAIPEFGAEATFYDTTSISDLAKTFGKDQPDYGDLTITGIWDSTDPAQAYLLASSASSSAVEVFTADFAKKSGGTTAAKAVVSGLVLSFRVSAQKGGPQRFSCKVKLTGGVTWTAAT